MLEGLRKAAQGWVAKILLGLLIVSFAVWGIGNEFIGAISGGQILATVGEESLTQQEFQSALDQRLKQISSQTDQPITQADAAKQGLDRQILDDIVNERLLNAEAKSRYLAISDQTIVRALEIDPNFKGANGTFDPARMRSLLEQNGLTEQRYVAMQRGSLARDAVIKSVAATFTPPKTLIEAAWRYENEARAAKSYTISLKSSDIPAPSAADLKAWYEAHPQDFIAPEYRKVNLLVASPDLLASRIMVPEADLKAAFVKQKATLDKPATRSYEQISFPDLATAEAAAKRIAGGEDFLAVAKAQGYQPSDISFANRTQSSIPDAKIATAVFALPKDGVSPPVVGALTVAIVRVTGATEAHQATFEEARAGLENTQRQTLAMAELRKIFEQIEDERGQMIPLADIAKSQSLTFITYDTVDAAGLDKTGKPVAMPAQATLLPLVFRTDAGVENNAYQAPDGSYIWYDVSEIVPAKLRPLDTVIAPVTQAFMAKKLNDMVLAKAEAQAQALNKGASFDDQAKAAGSPVQTWPARTRISPDKANDPASDTVFVMSLFATPAQKFGAVPNTDGISARVYQVTSVATPAFDVTSPGAGTIRNGLASRGAQDVEMAYLAGLRGVFGVSIDEELWRKTSGTAPVN